MYCRFILIITLINRISWLTKLIFTRNVQNISCHLLITLLAALLPASPLYAARIPGLPGVVLPENSVIAAAPLKNENEPERLKELLKAAKADFDKIDSPGGLAIGAPPGTPEHELFRRRFLLRMLTRNYDRQLTELENIATWHQKRKELDKRVAEGVRFKEKPPYSVMMIEGLREQVQVGFYRVKDAEIAVDVIAVKIKNAADSLKKAEERQRKLAEEIEKESDPTVVVSLEWQKGLTDLSRKVHATTFSSLQAAQKRAVEELLVARQEFAFLEKRLEVASKDSSFTENDLKNIKERLEGRKRLFELEVEKALAENQSLRKKTLIKGRKTLEERQIVLGEITGAAASKKDNTIKVRETLFQEELENSNLKIEVYQDLLDLNRLELLIWEMRYTAETQKNVSSIRSIVSLLPKVIAELDRLGQSSEAGLKLVLRQLNERESLLAQPEIDAEQDSTRRLIELYQLREKLLLIKIREVEAVKSIFVRLRDQYSESTKKAAADAKFKYWKVVIFEQLSNLWKYELFTTEDIVVVDGREVRGKRGITVGKLMIALLILIFGYIASAKVTKKIVRYIVARYDIQESTAMLARRWAMAGILIILLLSSLNLVRIPLTAFAFLGGAIAIGVGFGMQVLMKNLMSGMMLLAERPFRIGDLVDVDGIRGRVTSIGIRSSTIRDVTGIETLIPNSTFVEKNVTNWTYSTHQVRYSVTVGVAYGSDIAMVKKQLLQVASSHEQVLKEPKPIATLDDFASDALLFGLFYWLALDAGGDPRVIASDLRTMIEKQLSAEGIVIAYPQRDVHLDTIRPLQVEVITKTAAGSPQ